MRYQVDARVGRLVEARLFALKSVDEVAVFEGAMRDAFGRVAGQAVICADWRQANILAPEVASRLVELLLRGNVHLERSAVLLAREHATFNLQVERLVREAANPARRTFRSVDPVLDFLGEVLSPPERARVAAFLAET